MELLFCAKGQNTYVKCLGKNEKQKLELRLNEKKYKTFCSHYDSLISDMEKADLQIKEMPSAPRVNVDVGKPDQCVNKVSTIQVNKNARKSCSDLSLEKSSLSSDNINKKQSNKEKSDFIKPDQYVEKVSSIKVKNTARKSCSDFRQEKHFPRSENIISKQTHRDEEVSSIKIKNTARKSCSESRWEKSSPRKKPIHKDNFEVSSIIINKNAKSSLDDDDDSCTTKIMRNAEHKEVGTNVIEPFTDETIFGETEGRIVQEISEIMHEASQMNSPASYSEDIHLKNSGSQPTYSQFCAGAKGKSKVFKTSTEDNVCDNSDKVSFTSKHLELLTRQETFSKKKCIAKPQVPLLRSEFTNLEAENTTSERVPSTNRAVHSGSVNNIEVESICMEPLEYCPSETAFDACVPNPPKNIRPLLSSDSSEAECLVLHIGNSLNASSKENDSASNIKRMETDSTGSLVIHNSDSDSVSTPPSLPESLITDEYIPLHNPTQVSGSRHLARNKVVPKKRFPINKSCFFTSRKNHLHTEELNNLLDDEKTNYCSIVLSSVAKLPALTFNGNEKYQDADYVTVLTTIQSMRPSFRGSWKENCIKSKCPSCGKIYNSYQTLQKNLVGTSSRLYALSNPDHIACTDSECCNQVLDPPEFHFVVDATILTGTTVTAHISGKYAEQLFGCSAQEAVKNEIALRRVSQVLERIDSLIEDRKMVNVDFTRANVWYPTIGPLYIQKLHFNEL